MTEFDHLDAQRIAAWTQPNEVLLDVDVRDRRHAIEMAASIIAQACGRACEPVMRALWRREQVGSTAIGESVAIPHARIPGIDRPVTLFLRSRWAIDFEAPDGKPVRDIMVILVPEGGDPDEHLHLLAAVSEMFSDRAFRARIEAATDAAEARAAFADWSVRFAGRASATV